MKTKIFRLLVCLLLICSFMINLLPTRAEAISTGVAVSAGIVASAIIYGLGVAIGEYPDDFNSLVAEFISDMETAGVVVTNGLMDVMSLGSGLFGVKSDVIQTLFSWIHDSKTINAPGVSLATSGQYYINNRIKGIYETSAPAFLVAFLTPNGGGYGETLTHTMDCYLVSDTIFSYNNQSCYTRSDGLRYKSFSWTVAIDPSNLSGIKLMYGSFNDFTSSEILDLSFTTEQDLTLNFVANPGVSLATGYPIWHSNSVTIPNAETGEDDTYYPIAIGNSLEETQSFTQEQVWAGAGTYVDSESVPGTGDGTITVPDNATLKDILTGVLALPQSIAQAVSGFFANVVSAVQAIPAVIQAIPAAITDFFTITAEDLAIPVTWTDFFPFCIPWDIYELVTVLDAEPEAPHFVFDVDFPYMDEPWHIDIDFSAWDPVALVLRRLELLLFVVGLAMATRNYYIRG